MDLNFCKLQAAGWDGLKQLRGMEPSLISSTPWRDSESHGTGASQQDDRSGLFCNAVT